MRKSTQALFFIIFIVMHIFIIRNIFLLSKDMFHGDYSANKVIPTPRYPYVRIPDSTITEQYHAQGRLAIDFAQIYFPSQQMALLSQNYQTGVLDPLRRPSRYAPLVHFLCSITICKLDYGIASLLQMVIQISFFYIVFIYSMKTLKLEKDILLGVLFVNCYLFLTPAGLSWFEKGQLSLYVSIAYLLMTLGFIKRNNLLVLLSALFAFIKWTSLPYMAVALPVYILNSKSLTEGKRTLLLASTFLLIIISLSLLFSEQSFYFLKGLYDQERFAFPGGISLAKVLPVWMVKMLPLPLIILGFLHVKANQNVMERILPFLTGAAILMLTYPTLAYEYNLPSLLCFIPLLFYWAKLTDNPIILPIRAGMKYSFLVFMFLAAFSNYLNQRVIIVMCLYILISAILLIFPLFYWMFTRYPYRTKRIHYE